MRNLTAQIENDIVFVNDMTVLHFWLLKYTQIVKDPAFTSYCSNTVSHSWIHGYHSVCVGDFVILASMQPLFTWRNKGLISKVLTCHCH